MRGLSSGRGRGNRPWRGPPLLSTEWTGMVVPPYVGEAIQSIRTAKDKEQRGCRAGGRVQQIKEKGDRINRIYNLTKVELTQES